MRTIGKYEVLGLLGRGGMGTVYKVRIPVTRKIVALKLLKPVDLLADLMGQDRITRLFEAEAVTMASFRHPNIAGVWDYGHDHSGRPFFIMEYFCDNLGAVIGETYRVEAPTRVLSLERAASYTLQVLAGLARLHHAGIVHRDIKPFNILLADDDTAKITDFGLSRLRGEGAGLHGSVKAGSPYYAAPEQERSPEAAEAPADLYSVGVMLYRMLTGALPPEPDMSNGPSTGPVHCRDPRIPFRPTIRPSTLNPDLDTPWDDFLAHALAPDPARRFQTAPAMAAELSRLLVRWRDHVASTCRLVEDAAPGATPLGPADGETRPLPQVHPGQGDQEGGRPRPRSTPIRVYPDQAREVFGLDQLWRPERYVDNDFLEINDPGGSGEAGGIVVDRASGLAWQRSGSPYVVSWEEAREFVAGLNRDRFGGTVGWRLPTMAELSSILRPIPHQADFCAPSTFDPAQRKLWSGDRKSFCAAWYADVSLGFVGFQDFTCGCWVRAVRDLEQAD